MDFFWSCGWSRVSELGLFPAGAGFIKGDLALSHSFAFLFVFLAFLLCCDGASLRGVGGECGGGALQGQQLCRLYIHDTRTARKKILFSLFVA